MADERVQERLQELDGEEGRERAGLGGAGPASARLEEAGLMGADLRGADLIGADLRGAGFLGMKRVKALKGEKR